MLNIAGVQQMVEDEIRDGLSRERFTLGTLIDHLEAVKNKAITVQFDLGYLHPTTFASWRGVYAHLAIGYEENGVSPTVDALLAAAMAANGGTFTGYKGGEYTMGRDTPLWVANRGESPYTCICGLIDDGYTVILQTMWDEF